MLKVNEYGERQAKGNEKNLCFKGRETLVIYKQRGRFFDVKRRPFHCKETPSSKRRRRLFVFSSAVPANEA